MKKPLLTFSEILNYAIVHMSKDVVIGVNLIKAAGTDSERYAIRIYYGEKFSKMAALLRMYENETGKPYELEALCGLKIPNVIPCRFSTIRVVDTDSTMMPAPGAVYLVPAGAKYDDTGKRVIA